MWHCQQHFSGPWQQRQRKSQTKKSVELGVQYYVLISFILFHCFLPNILLYCILFIFCCGGHGSHLPLMLSKRYLRLFIDFRGPTNIRTEAKFIVFLSQLLTWLSVCPTYDTPGPAIETCQVGTMVCRSPTCPKKEFTWQSQPYVEGTRTPAGNILFSFVILVSSASPSKVLNLFSQMGLASISLRTFFRYQHRGTIAK